MRNAKIRRIEGKSPEEFDHFHVGGTTLCADYARDALIEAAKIATGCDQVARKRCKFSNNYPPMATNKPLKTFKQCSSIYV